MQPVVLFLNIALFLGPCLQSMCSTEKVLENVNLPTNVKGNDCTHIKKRFPDTPSGVYLIQPIGKSRPFQVFCDMKDGKGWTIFQVRNGLDSLNYNKGWAAYKKGFGKSNREHWLGLENIYSLTNQANKTFKLRVNLKDFENGSAYAEYSEFRIDNGKNNYRLHLGSYSGNAGDAFRGSGPPTEDQNGHMFSTYDQDNDGCTPCIFDDTAIESCSEMFSSGWWFSQCGMADLNGIWHPKDNNVGWTSGIHWKTWKQLSYSLKFCELKVVSV
uniref:angiopoietin-related protein 5-like n=1 Tax=Pristiophorus japonicus TaxID=55135 RepID=UPI00398F5A4F